MAAREFVIHRMLNVLVLTTDLPFFPGKMGVDFFNLRHLAETHRVGVVAPLHEEYPAEGVANLERFLDRGYFWPRPADPVTLPPLRDAPGSLSKWLRIIPRSWRARLLLKLLGQSGQSLPDVAMQIGTLSNCAPLLLAALHDRAWQAVVIIQSSSTGWFDYLPSHLPRVVYFHDVRAQYLRRRNITGQEGGSDGRKMAAIFQQEARALAEADVVGFVSELDKERADQLYSGTAERRVAPIPIDTKYYLPRPAGWKVPAQAAVLFTGHLSHPPNVDAVLFFLKEIWPRVRAARPDAKFEVVGVAPRADLSEACRAAPDVQLHANVPDIRPHFWNARVYVVPMRFGGGVRQKIFEAWAMGVPMVATQMAVEGTLAEDGVNCWLRDDPIAFADEVVRLLDADPPPGVIASASRTAQAFNSIAAAAPQFQKLVERAPAIKRGRPFKILFDLRWMKIGRAGGIEQLAYELISSISKLDHRNGYRLYCPRSTFWEWSFPRGFQARPIYCDGQAARWDALRAEAVNGLAPGLKVPPLMTPPLRALRAYREMDFDLVHSICSYIHPDLASFPNVLTMCDLQHCHFPEFFSAAAWAERERLYRTSCESARHILCISEFTRQDIHRTYGTPLERMSTVWIAPSRPTGEPLSPRVRRDILGRLGVPEGRYFFFPAHPWPHKNHRRLIEAFALALTELPRDTEFILTGKPFPPDHPALEAIEHFGLSQRVRHLGFRSPLEITALHAGALALVFPSLFEGFGLPVTEAILAGIPIACSNTTSLPEIAGPAALYFDPTDTTDISRQLVRVATDANLRKCLVEAGNARKSLFSPRQNAIRTLAAYHQVFQEYYAS
jgi:glycosyltransferase involved in cell wall biosynthesis